ncbi:hotdog fold thioesterase [Streptosporangium vulgare]
MTDHDEAARRVEEALGASYKNTLVDRMDIQITEATAERVVGTMPVEGNIQPLRPAARRCLVRAGGDPGLDGRGDPRGPRADRHGRRDQRHPTTARPTSGLVTGVATRIHGGRTLATYDIEIVDEQGRRVCTSRLTCMLRDA